MTRFNEGITPGISRTLGKETSLSVFFSVGQLEDHLQVQSEFWIGLGF